MERIKTIATRDLTKSVQTGGCGECQLQDFLRRGKPEVRERKQVNLAPSDAAFAGRHFFVGCFVLYGGQNGTSV